MGNKRRALIVVAMAAIAALAIGVLAFNTKEPAWNGRRLGAWLNDFDADKPEKRLQAAEAVSQIGSNAVPFLIPRLAYPRYGPISQWSGLKTRILFLLSKQRFIKFPLPQPTSPRHQALAAIDTLGPSAESALPALEKLLHEKPPDPRVPYIFARIGPTGVPFLNQALTNNERAIRMGARLCLDALKSPSDPLFASPGPSASGYDRRTCEFNLRMVNAAFREYRSQHPEMNLPANVTDPPPPRLPPGFNPESLDVIRQKLLADRRRSSTVLSNGQDSAPRQEFPPAKPRAP